MINIHSLIPNQISNVKLVCKMEYLIKLPNKMIKAGCDNISKPLAYILNMSLTQGIFPD